MIQAAYLRSRAGWLAVGAFVVMFGMPAVAQFNGTEQTQLVTEHNSVRFTVRPIAMPMLTGMVWSSTRAAAAQSWANLCMWAHSGTPGVGENLYASTGDTNPRPTPNDIVQNWAAEVANYNYTTNGCSDVCGHYTQVVWRPATQVGCGIATCSPGSNPFPPPFNGFNWTIVVCQYNTIQNGARPYLCDYDGNGSTTDICTPAFFADGFDQTQTLPGNWSFKTP